MLLYLLLVGAVAVVGGLWPALFAAVTTSLVVNWFFTPPVHTWTIAEADNVVALAVFLLVAGMVSLLVSRLSRRSADAVRARAEAEAIAAVAGNLVDAENALEVAVGHLRSTFGLDAVAVLQPDGDGYLIEASAGEPVPSSPEGHVSVDLRGGALLVLDGPSLHSDDLQVLHAFVAQLGAALEQRDLRAEAQVAAAAAEGDRLRTAILRAVSHDLRTPLASIKASVTSLMQHDVDWSEHDRDEFLATIEEEADRLNRMVGNLLDMSRLQSGTVEPGLRPVGLEEVVPRALVSISGEAAELGREQVVVEVGEQLPRVVADPDLLERVIANLVANALLHSGPGTPVRIEGGRVGTRVDLRVVDRGIGVPLRDREAMFEPFQRMGDGVADSGRRARAGGLARVRRRHGRGADGRRHPGRWPHLHRLAAGGVVTRVLVVDDEPQIRRALSTNLRARGYEVELAATGEEALQLVVDRHPDVVVLDLGLPGIDGLEVVRSLRTWSRVPIVVLSVREAERDKVAALDAGADDYVTKPFGMSELLARLRAAVRRSAPADDEPLVDTDDFVVDLATKQVRRHEEGGDVEVHLTPTEWSLLELLARRRGRLVSQDDLLTEVWGPGNERKSDHLRVHMAAIRRKLERDPSRPRWLLTEPGMGYRFV